PSGCRARERRCLEEMLHASDGRALGALPAIWHLQEGFTDEDFREEKLHARLEIARPEYGPLLSAVRSYEAFARGLQDAFDVLRAEASRVDSQGFDAKEIADDEEFRSSTNDLDRRFEFAHRSLGEIGLANVALQNLFSERFEAFAAPMAPAEYALS